MNSSSNQTKAYDFKTRDIKVLKKLLPYLLKMRARVIWAVSFLMLAKLANVAVPLALKEIVDSRSDEYNIGIATWHVASLWPFKTSKFTI